MQSEDGRYLATLAPGHHLVLKVKGGKVTGVKFFEKPPKSPMNVKLETTHHGILLKTYQELCAVSKIEPHRQPPPDLADFDDFYVPKEI